MAEDIKKVPEEINDEELEKIAGGLNDKEGNWLCKYCGVSFPEVKTATQIKAHFYSCQYSPYRK